jgi:RimJ/RimL family protein N-acetyltransferase
MMEDDMELKFRQFIPSEINSLIDFLTSDTWPFHLFEKPEPGKIMENFNKGLYDDEDNRTFWILSEKGDQVGMLRLFDLTMYSPMFDLRLKTAYRRMGLGEKALRWLMEYVFKTWPEKTRLDGETRKDNIAMRRLFRNCGFVKEAHYRKAWPDQYGNIYDSIGYGILREDWKQNKVTPVEWDGE